MYGSSPTEQAEQYATALRACLAAPNCTSYTSWGVTDRYGSTTEAGEYPLQFGDDLQWNTDLQPKRAVTALTKVLRAG